MNNQWGKKEPEPSWADPTNNFPKPPDPEHIRATLIEYAEKGIDVYVPGHGNLCTKKVLRENAEYNDEYYIVKG